jgi:hypothetical protein
LNSKLFKASIAGVAAITLAATGSTFAAWSDLGTVSANKTDAGHLKLDLNSTGAITNVGGTPIAPGESRTIDQMVGSADLAGVTSAALSMKIVNLVDQENGCGSSTSEAAVDPDCATAGTPGEFSKEAYVRVRYSNPAPLDQLTFAKNNCTAPGGLTNAVGYAVPSNNDTTVYPRLTALTGNSPLGTLLPNQGICVRIDLGLDKNATNAVQSDSSTFDVQFDLTQILP